MTAHYVRSGAAGSNNGTSWANAYTTMTAAIAGGAAGDTYYVSEDHAESTAGSVALAFNGTSAVPDLVICVNHAGSVPPVSADLRTTGQITVTGAAVITTTGYAKIYGIIFNNATGSGSNNLNIGGAAAVPVGLKLINCQLNVKCTGTGARIVIGTNTSGGSGTGYIELFNTTCSFSNASQGLTVNGTVYWRNTPSLIQGATIPTTLISVSSAVSSIVLFEGCDLSALASGHIIVGAVASALKVIFVNCKLGASVTIAATPTIDASIIDLINCDSAATTNRQERYTYAGTLSTETTVVRSGGANDSVQSMSWKIITTANTNNTFPFETFPIDTWNSKVGQTVNVNLEILNDGVTLQNSDIYLDVYGLTDTTDPLASLISSGPADPLAAGANISSSSASWVTTGLTSPIAQKITVSFTPQTQGYIRAYVRIPKVSKTIWVDPAIYFS